MSDSETARESLPSISDLSLNPQTAPSAKAATTEAKAKKDVEKGLHRFLFLDSHRTNYLINRFSFSI